MQIITVNLGRYIELKGKPPPPMDPLRTAVRAHTETFGGMQFRQWPSRRAMLTACKMSNTGVLGNLPWRPVIKEY